MHKNSLNLFFALVFSIILFFIAQTQKIEKQKMYELETRVYHLEDLITNSFLISPHMQEFKKFNSNKLKTYE